MSVSTNGKAVLAATRELGRKWHDTKQSWRDSKSSEFEKKYLTDLVSEVERAIPILEELDRAMAAARTECE